MINWSDFDTNRNGRSPSLGLLLAALAALTVFRLWGLAISEVELTFDEAQYWSWSLEPAWGYFSKPPLIAWLIGFENAICGTGEVCIRSAAPILHFATSLLVYSLGRRIFSPEAGFWSAVMFALLPGIAFSSRLITTDVPLLFCWSIGLFCVWELRARRSVWFAVLLGVAIGIGLLAKYAMIYFVLCLAIFLIIDRRSRRKIWKGGLVIAGGVALLLLAPNVLWNVQNGLITLLHTAENASWGGQIIRPAKAAEFLGAQFGVFGPIAMAILLAVAFRPRAATADDTFPTSVRFLYAFSVPVIGIILFQALMSRAHANWAAPAYVAGTLLVTQTLLAQSWRRVLIAIIGLNIIVQGALVFMDSRATRLTFPFGIDLYHRALGFEELARRTQTHFDARPDMTILTDWRRVTATLLYNLRDSPAPIVTWPHTGRPHDHYQLTRPLIDDQTGPFLLITRCNIQERLDHAFERWDLREVVTTKGGPRYNWTFLLIMVDGPRLDSMPDQRCSSWPSNNRSPIVDPQTLPPTRVR